MLERRKGGILKTQVVDPRPPRAPKAPDLAKRHPSLSGRSIALLDNGKLAESYGPYLAIFDSFKEEVNKRHSDVQFVSMTYDLLAATGAELDDIARRIGVDKHRGVVIALCDWGVSQPSTILASKLETMGIPTTIVATPVGTRQVLAAASKLMPGLPVTELTALRSATTAQLTDELLGISGKIVDGLTRPAEDLELDFAKTIVPTPDCAVDGRILHLEGDDIGAAFTELMRDSLLGDGLPMVAPTVDRVDEFLGAVQLTRSAEIWPAVFPRTLPVTAFEVAALAIAAGCRSQWAPVVFAAFRAMAKPEFRLFQAAITTHPGGTFVLVSGPDARKYGLADGRGALGPGFDANATIGRAIALGYSFFLGAIPGGSDMTAQGSPAEYSYCCAENLAGNPWPGLHSALGFPDATTVTVSKCEGPHNVTDQQSVIPTSLLGTFASALSSLGSNTAYVAGAETILLLNPEHARLLSDAGWSRRDVQEYIFDSARNDRESLVGRGIGTIWPVWFDGLERVPVIRAPSDLYVAVVGGEGPASQVVLPWGYSRSVTLPIEAIS